MDLTPVRIDPLTLDGDSLDSYYTLLLETDHGCIHIGKFETFYALNLVFEDLPKLLILMIEQGLVDEVAQIQENGVEIAGEYFPPP